MEPIGDQHKEEEPNPERVIPIAHLDLSGGPTPLIKLEVEPVSDELANHDGDEDA